MFGSKKKNGTKSRDTAKAKESAVFAPRRSPRRPFVALACAALAVLIALSLAFYAPGQPVLLAKWLASSAGAPPVAPPGNPVGIVGATYAALSNYVLGWAGMIFVPVFLLWVAFLFVSGRSHAVRPWKLQLMVVVLLSAAGLAAMLGTLGKVGFDPNYFPRETGGWVGWFLYNRLMLQPLGNAGSAIVLGLVYLVGLVFLFADHPGQAFEGLLQSWALWREQRALAAQKLREARQKEQAALATAKEIEKAQAAIAAVGSIKAAVDAGKPEKPVKEPKPAVQGLGTFKLKEEERSLKTAKDEGKIEETELKDEKPAVEETSATKAKLPRAPKVEPPPAPPATAPSKIKIIQPEAFERVAASQPTKKGDYVFPTVDLLAPAEQRQTDTAEFHEERAQQLERTLAEFGVKVIPTEIQTGPVITRYEVTPAPGVRVEKIVNLDKNLALALKAEGVRIIAPVPGKGTVGIEVPNRHAATVCLREIIESKAWTESKAEIPVVLGKDVTGRPMVVDLTKMPHALIAGSTGAGKTVCINAIIASLVFKLGPEDLRFIMVDPKIVEMQVFNKLPHMLVPVVTSAKKVPAALKYLIGEMERRYQIFARIGARNIAGYNAKILKDKDSEEKAEELDAEMSPEERAATQNIQVPRDADIEIEHKKLPYIVCIIDELADLMMVAPADIETCVARLAQLARAAGIHLILATQRPSVNVITGVIKANLPCRIAFKVASKVDSRTILDTGGADTLIGRGDMLFVPPGTANLVRAQGAFVSDDEINQIVEFLERENEEPDFADDVQAQIEAGAAEGEEGEGGEDDEEWDDNLVPQAIDVLKATKRASTSMLQRRLKIGYNRAARIMEILEAEGIVGPENGPMPREILKDLESL